MAVYAISDGISKAMPFLILPIVAYFLPPSQLGLVTNFNVLCQFLFAISMLNTHTYLTVDYYKTSEENKPVLILNIFYLIGILLTISLLGTIFFKNLIFRYSGITIKWQMYALIWVGFNAAIYIYQTKLRLDEKAKQFGVYQFGQSLVSVGFTLLFVVWLKWGWQGRIDGLVLTNIAVGGFGLYMLLKGKTLTAKFEWYQIRKAFIFGIPLLPHTLSFWFKSGLENIYITNAVSISDNGIYAFAGTLTSIFFLITNAFFAAYTPYLFKELTSIEAISNDEEKHRIKIKLLKQLKYFILVYAVANVAGYLVIKLIIDLFFIKDYGASIQYIPWLQFSSFCFIFYGIFAAYVFYMKSTKILGIITLSTAVLQTVLNYFAVTNFGVMGIIVVGIVINILMAVLVGLHSNKVYPMPWKYLFVPSLR
ncbi:MAG: hypothetical protein C0412_08760 [Flavobacterium sp.]|nr:hypothetical protein [Flavobacterium sp.]